MKITLLIVLLCSLAQAQGRVDIGIAASGSRALGFGGVDAGVEGHLLIKLSAYAIDGKIEYLTRAASLNSEMLVRRYVVGKFYMTSGPVTRRPIADLFTGTATTVLTGAGYDGGVWRLQLAYEVPDFTSGQSASAYRIEGEAVKHLKGSRWYGVLRPSVMVNRFEKGTPFNEVLTGARFGISFSVGKDLW